MENDDLSKLEKAIESATAKSSQRFDAIEKKLTAAEKLAVEAATLANRPTITGGNSKADERLARLEQFNIERKSVHLAKNMTPPGDADMETYNAFRKAQLKLFRVGDLNLLDDGERKAMSAGSDPSGGYLINPDMGGKIVSRLFETSPMRQVATVVTCGSDSLEGIADLNDFDSGWVGETGNRTETDSADIGKYRIVIHEQYCNPKATQKLLDDSSLDIESYIGGKIADRFARVENTAFVSGDGVAKPRGFYSYTTEATVDASRDWGKFEHVLTGTNAGFGSAPNGADKILDLIHKIKAPYRQNAAFAMNKLTLGAVRQLKNSNGDHIFLDSLVAGTRPTILGYPVYEFEDLPNFSSTEGLNALWFGDWRSAYTIADRVGIRTLRDPFTAKPYVHFYSTRRVGGDAVDFDALKALKFST